MQLAAGGAARGCSCCNQMSITDRRSCTHHWQSQVCVPNAGASTRCGGCVRRHEPGRVPGAAQLQRGVQVQLPAADVCGGVERTQHAGEVPQVTARQCSVSEQAPTEGFTVTCGSSAWPYVCTREHPMFSMLLEAPWRCSQSMNSPSSSIECYKLHHIECTCCVRPVAVLVRIWVNHDLLEIISAPFHMSL